MALAGLFATMTGGGLIAGTTIGSFASRKASVGMLGGLIGASLGARKFTNIMQQGTTFTNPMFNTTTGQAYGKRGIDANRLNTQNLVQNLHQNRRRF